ncbi:MAG: hypothetical protein K2M17_03225 [Bacilli bacterium]|nr:hypothetical protein [Bacilli bacterium]
MSTKFDRGQQELLCLQAVKKYISTAHPIHWFLDDARPNENLSDFPDFIFERGFIEHFQVTSAKETSRGDKHRISEAQFEKESQEEFGKNQKEFLRSTPNPGTFSTKVLEMVSPEYSYKNFVDSFKRNFEHHIRSLDNYDGDKSIGIFLLEYTGAPITVVPQSNSFRCYKIAYDKDLLSYLFRFREKLKYLICFWGDTQGDLNGEMSCEIVEMSRVPNLLKNVPQDISFGVGRYRNLRLNLFIDL